ncbi:MAG: PEP/pyruvate-binding domain-containing protein [Methanomassiliicoccales archaeon]
MDRKTLKLGEVKPEEKDIVGSKAFNLSILASNGFPVPEGFVITTKVYEKFLQKMGLGPIIQMTLTNLDFDDEGALEAASRKIRDLITQADVEPWVRSEFEEEVRAMGEDSLWAVRSSALEEDLVKASFAGQQDTYLNVTVKDVPRYVKRCWASYFNERALAYRKNTCKDATIGGVAVIVQRMVNSRSSGILFTRDPLDPENGMMIIESSWGLGESIASGMVVPDRFRCERRHGRIVSKEISRKAKAVYLDEQMRGPVEVEEAKQGEPSLQDAEIKELVRLGAKLEDFFQCPQDVEWAIEGEKIYLLQSRPITTLDKESGTLWTRAYGDEYWADVTSPLFFSWLGYYLTEIVNHEGARIMGYRDLAEIELLRLHKGHVYFNTEVLEGVFSYNPRFSRTKELLNYFPLKDQDRIANARARLGKRLLAELRIAVMDPDGMINRTDKAYRKWAESFMEYCQIFDGYDLKNYQDQALEEVFRELEGAFIKHYRLIRYGMVTHSIGTNLMLKRWLQDWLQDHNGELYSKLISGLPDNKTIKTNIALAALASKAKSEAVIKEYLEKLPSSSFLEVMMNDPRFEAFRKEFQQFLVLYGCRSHTRELYFPRWADDPAMVVDILRSLVQVQHLDLEEEERRRREERERTEREVLLHVSRMKGGLVRKRIMRLMIKYAQTYLQFRENQRFYLDHILLRTRRLFMEYGRRFKERGWIDRQDDIFFLSKEEIFEMARSQPRNVEGLKSKIASRRREFERWRNRLPPKFLRGDLEFDDTVYELGNVMRLPGASASPGLARGRVRVVESIENISEVQEGEILVTSNTDPGWTAVFPKIAGLITETGGILSHGAVVSREYGLPAVTAVKGATKILKTGQQVTLDGNEGVIYLEEM